MVKRGQVVAVLGLVAGLTLVTPVVPAASAAPLSPLSSVASASAASSAGWASSSASLASSAIAVGSVAPGDLGPVMLVLDASGSMQGSAGGGSDKMTVARQAVRTLVRQVPEGARLGLAVYGTSTGNTGAEKAAGCRDVQVVQPVGPVDRAAFTAVADRVRPRGYTPISRALRVAAAALPAEGPRSIVLVSDGEDTCAPPDPCQVAGELAGQGVDLRVHAVGFAVDRKARRQLGCIAKATRGTYTDAADAAELGRALNRVTQQALRTYQPTGTPIVGGADPGSAAPVTPGAYLDDIDPGQGRFYAVDVPAGHTLYASATPVLSPGVRASAESMMMTVYEPDGTQCGSFDFNMSATDPITPTTRKLVVPLTQSAETRPCQRPGRYVVGVARQDLGGSTAPLELLFGLEPPPRDERSMGAPPQTATVGFQAPGGEARPVVGGGSFNTAGSLDGSGSYRDTVWEGEFVFYRVRVGWGQGLAYRVRYGNVDLDNGLVTVGTSAYTPSREESGHDFVVNYDGDAVRLPQQRDAYATVPIRYLNRTRGSEQDRALSMAGWYYLAVKVGDDRRGEPSPVPVELDVAVVGDVEPGPVYAGSPATDAFGEGFGPAPNTSTSASAGPAAAGDESAGTAEAASASGSRSLAWLVTPLSVVFLAGAVGAWLLIRRYRAAPVVGAVPNREPPTPPGPVS